MVEAFDNPKQFGPYTLFGKVAQGGMAEVFIALSSKKEHQGQFIAIKKLHSVLNQNKAFVNLLIHEAKVGVLLNHPAIAQVFDLGSQQGEFFIAMEYVHGKSLDRLIEKIESGKAEKLDKILSTYLVCECLRGLAFAHSLKDIKGRDLSIIHRDVTPGNILLEYKGLAKLADFGIATAEARLKKDFTRSAMGKLHYMPPEQVVNDPVKRASDLFSLAVVYYQLLIGRLPFESQDPAEIYRKIVDGKLEANTDTYRELPEYLKPLFEKALEPVSKNRFQSAAEFFQAIRQIFLNEHQIDLDSKKTRFFYKKKFSQYLCTVFSEELKEEADLIQKALSNQHDVSELKETAPQEIPKNIETAPEPSEMEEMEDKTVFHHDVTDEVTRFYPMSDQERSDFLKESGGDAEDENERTSGFRLRTIPSYDLELELEEDPFNAKTVNEKLESSSLNPELKRELKEQLPALEILSSQELDAFEKSTFSGKQTPIEADSIITKKISKSNESSSEKTMDEATEVYAKAPSLPRKKISFDFRKASSFAAVGVFLIAVVYVFGEASLSKLFMPAFEFVPTQQISIVITGDDSEDKLRQLFTQWQSEDSSLNQIEQELQSAYENFSGYSGAPPLLKMLTHSPLLLETPLESKSDDSSIFIHLEKNGVLPRLASDATIFIYASEQANQWSPAQMITANGHRKIFIPLAISKAASHKEQIKTQILRSYSKDSSISFDEINESTAKKLGWIP